MVAFNLIAAKAHKTTLNVAPAGCGKSEVNLVMRDRMPDVLFFDSVTRAGLSNLEQILNGFTGTCIVDDLGKVESTYLRINTMTTFCELVYSHFVEKHTARGSLSIMGFEGSAVLGCQPIVLRRVMMSPEWDATIQDKTIRYYHLFRPLEPEPTLPAFDINWSVKLGDVERPNIKGKEAERLLAVGSLQWSRARTREHVSDLLCATAALDGRTVIDASDYVLLLRLMQPLKIEQLVMLRTGFEEGKEFDHNLLCILVEFASYGSFTLADLARDYRVSGPTAMGLMARARKYWRSVKNNDERFYPVDSLVRLLEQLDARKEGSVSDGGSARANSARPNRKASGR